MCTASFRGEAPAPPQTARPTSHLCSQYTGPSPGVSTPILEQYPALFTGLGTFKGSSYKIKLKPNAKPCALLTPQNVPLPLRKKVQRELAHMESLGAGMVAVPNKSGSMRICVDFRPLNDNVLHEVHPLPKVVKILAQLAGAPASSVSLTGALEGNCYWSGGCKQ